MKTLNDLSAVAVDAEWVESRGLVTTLHHELAPGRFVNIGLGEAGLVFFADKTRLGIPLAALMALALAHEPALDRVQVSIEEAEAQAEKVATALFLQAQEASNELKRLRAEIKRRHEESVALLTPKV